MTITLTIDSVDSLPDGGPVLYSARQRGFEIGRQQHLDWTLPDPSRHISGLHCEVRFENGAYMLYDVSSNGTFLNGSTSRMKSPHRLANGDRLTIGQYVVRVEVEGADGAVQQPAAQADFQPAPAPPLAGGDIWDTGAPAPPPIDRRDLMPEPAGRSRAADFSGQFIEFPDMKPASGPAPRPLPADPFADDPFAVPPPAQPSFARPTPAPPPADYAPAPVAQPIPPRPPSAFELPPARQAPSQGEPFAFAQPVVPVPPVPQPHAGLQGSGSGDSQGLARFLDGLAAGAGVPPATFSGRDPAELGHEIGEFMKVTVEQLAQLLRARATAKAMTKSSSRTMIAAADNNPLKFIPTPAEIIDVMFARKRPGYLGAKGALEGGFGDLKRHELATWTAMQKALLRLLDDFSPETISAGATGSVLSSKKSRSWEVFVERWETRTEGNENGMLDVFLAYFAEAYDAANKKG